jgi:hypothetical protein
MISSEVQRTLVKSPPELWAELSDPTSLARHLGELGEIRITRVEPERTVEWEAADTTGKVRLKASGWGTKVTLTAAREVAAPEAVAEPETANEASGGEIGPKSQTTEPADAVEVETEAEPVTAAEPQPAATAEPEPMVSTEPESGPEMIATKPEAEHEAVVEEPVKRPGFFARLFGRRTKEQAPPERPAKSEAAEEPELTAEAELTVEAEPAEEPELTARQPPPEQEATMHEATPPGITPQHAPLEDTPPAEVPDLAAELRSAEEAATAEVTAVLTAVLDRLGAAHHRPFSRS